MSGIRSDVARHFDRWAGEGRGDAMAEGHWPRTTQIIERMQLEPGMRVLDLGGGNGYAVRAMLDQVGGTGMGVGVDISEGMVTLARNLSKDYSNARFMKTAGDRLPFRDDAFDRILSVEVIYYAPDMAAVIEECYRVLRPGGSLWIMVDYYREHPYSAVWKNLLGFDIQYLSENGYRELFEGAGFQKVVTGRLFDPTPVDENEFRPGWGYDTVEELRDFRENIGSLLVTGKKETKREKPHDPPDDLRKENLHHLQEGDSLAG